MNILIAQNAKLGDMVCTTPLFRAVKQNIKDVRVIVMGNALNKELLVGNPHVDEYLVEPKSLWGIGQLLKEKKIDTAIIPGPNAGMLKALLWARVPHIIVPKIVGGWSPYATKTYRLLSLFATRVPIQFRGYIPREYLRLLEPLGIRTDDARKELAVSHEAVLRVTDLLAQKGYEPKKDFIVGIAPSAGAHKLKSWGAERFAKVADYLAREHNAVIAIIAGKGERDDADTMLKALPASVRVVDLCGVLSIEELKALVSLLSLYISSDTGPVHIAEAFDTPSVDVLGAVDEHEISIESPRHRVVFHPQRGEPAIHTMSAAVYDPTEARRQTNMITVEMVIATVEDLLAAIK